MTGLNRLIINLRILSLDIAIGGVVCSLAVAKMIGIEMPYPISGCLFLAIWSIYTIDHLIDSSYLKYPSMPRHQFHKKHQGIIRTVLFFAIVAGAFLASQLPADTLWMGAIIGIVVVVYFLTIMSTAAFIPKEIIVGAIYTIGVFIGPLSMYETFNIKILIVGFELWMIATFNAHGTGTT